MAIDDKTNLINVSSEYPFEVSRWNKADIESPLDRTVMSFFEQQVCDVPQHIADQFEGESLTYLVQNQRVNRVAKEHISRGIQTDDISR